MKLKLDYFNKILRASLLKWLAFFGCHMLSIVIKHKGFDNTYKEDMDDLKESAKEVREFILMNSKLDLKEDYNIPALLFGIDLVSPLFDEYCIICSKEKVLSKKKRRFL